MKASKQKSASCTPDRTALQRGLASLKLPMCMKSGHSWKLTTREPRLSQRIRDAKNRILAWFPTQNPSIY